jgi:hypothetical protein
MKAAVPAAPIGQEMPLLFAQLLTRIVRVNIVSPASSTRQFQSVDDGVADVKAETTAQLADAYVHHMHHDVALFTAGFFSGLATCHISDDPEWLACREINEVIGRIKSAPPDRPVLMVQGMQVTP